MRRDEHHRYILLFKRESHLFLSLSPSVSRIQPTQRAATYYSSDVARGRKRSRRANAFRERGKTRNDNVASRDMINLSEEQKFDRRTFPC